MLNMKIITVIPFKKIIGKITKLENGSYEVKDGFILEEVHTMEGMSIVPLPIIPSSPDEPCIFTSQSIIIEPVDVTDPKMIALYTKLTSNLVIPETSSKLIM